MADPFSGLPPELAAQLEAIRRRQELSKLLTAKSLQPIEAPQSKGRFQAPVSPFQGLAQLAQAYVGKSEAEGATKDFEKLGEQRNQMWRDEAANLLTRPAMQDPQEIEQRADQGSPESPRIPKTQQQILEAMMQSKFPELRNLGLGGIAEGFKYHAPTKVDAGDRVLVIGRDGSVTQIPKAATPDTVAREAGAERRHDRPSGSTLATNQAAAQRHVTPSGSAVLSAETARRGQDMSAATTIRGQDISADPEVQGRVARAKAWNKEMGESQAKAQLSLPDALAKSKVQLQLIDDMIGDLKVDEKGRIVRGKRAPHPGFEVGVGASVQPGFQFIPGTDKAGFYALKDQVLGGAFMQAFETLKGGGQITVIEGEKGTAAITRMKTTQNEAEFVKAAREFQDIIKSGMERAKQKASDSGSAPTVIDFNDLPKRQ